MTRRPTTRPPRTRAGEYLRGRRDPRVLHGAATRGDATSTHGWWDDVRTTGRLVRAWLRGTYRDVRLRSVLAVLTALAYFLSPVDLIPDVFLPLGLTDDAVVVTLLFSVVRKELAGFRAWESTPTGPPTGG